MSHRSKAIIAFAVGLALIATAYRLATPSGRRAVDPGEIVPNEYIATRRPGTSPRVIVAGASQTVLDEAKGIVLFRPRPGMGSKAIESSGYFTSIEPNRRWHIEGGGTVLLSDIIAKNRGLP